MRLRYLHLYGVPPLQDVAITFGHETILGRDCAIRFVVGVNGTGKSRLLQALAETLLRLERQDLPPFPVTLAYDLGRNEQARTIYLRRRPNETTSQALLIEYERLTDEDVADWESLPEQESDKRLRRYSGDDIPSGVVADLLPRPLLAYVSGATTDWEFIFTRRPQTNEADLEEEVITSDIGIFIATQDLRLAVFAMTLHQAWLEFQKINTPQERAAFIEENSQAMVEQTPPNGLRRLLNEVGWLWPVALSLEINFEPENWQADTWSSRPNLELERLYEDATTVIRKSELEENKRLLLFDLYHNDPQQTARNIENLINAFRDVNIFEEQEASEAEQPVTPFQIFNRLYTWQRNGILQNVTLALQKYNVDDLVLYDWLSDGERLFLGRMALFHLLQDEDDALILLDEPETHFNDIWKRRIVDIIDDSLGQKASDVIISTHSSIALTDVFKSEITLLAKDWGDGEIDVLEIPISTFGALPSEIMREIFGAPDSIGQRAQEYLDLVLLLAEHPDTVETVWNVIKQDGDKTILESPEFSALWEFARPKSDDQEQVLNLLRSLQRYTQKERELSDVSIIDALELLEEQIGPSYYNFEIGRRLKALRHRKQDATPG